MAVFPSLLQGSGGICCRRFGVCFLLAELVKTFCASPFVHAPKYRRGARLFARRGVLDLRGDVTFSYAVSPFFFTSHDLGYVFLHILSFLWFVRRCTSALMAFAGLVALSWLLIFQMTEFWGWGGYPFIGPGCLWVVKAPVLC